MIPSPHDEQFERLIHRTLRDLPPRNAPRSLERRVLAEIERRAALPWWRKSFAHWPGAARIAFIVLSAGLVVLILTLGVRMMAGFDATAFKDAFAQERTWLENGASVVRAITDFFDIMLRNIPPLWLYAVGAFLATMYFTLFGLGAAAYRVLHAQR